MGDELVKVRVKVMAREGFRGYYALQQFFPEGQTDLEITQAQLAELAADTGPIAFVELPADTVLNAPPPKEPTKEELIAAAKEIAAMKAELEADRKALAAERAAAKEIAVPPAPPVEPVAEETAAVEAPPEPEPTKKTRFR